ncbi:MAG TPA: ornithine cyclodeaminase family protein [Pyrinomonadaceae bacterium]|nr:ornithine cyclodeaminase family protein [Pyrinomonadaceae bacterium]
MRIISRKDVENSLTMGEAIEVVKNAFIELSNHTAQVPPRLHLSVEKPHSTTLIMPAYLGESDSLACKIVSVFPNNANLNLPIIYGLVNLIDAKTGKPLAIIEGASLTALRTGAASGLATDLLARKDAKILAVFGAGAQSRTQVEAVCAVRKIEKIFVYSRRIEQTKEFIAEMKTKGRPEFIMADSPKEAVSQADIVCAATTSQTPVFDGNDLKEGTHINGIGSFKPTMQEIDFVTLKKCSKIVVDSIENAISEAGDLTLAIETNIIKESDIYGEIGDIAKCLKNGRESEDEITFFKSVGNAVQDASMAKAIFDIALKRNIGQIIDL